MPTYKVFFSEDAPTHASLQLKAPDDASALARAVEWYRGTCELGPDWRRTYRRQLTLIENQSKGRIVAHSLSLDPAPVELGLNDKDLLSVPAADLIRSCMAWLDREDDEGKPFGNLLNQVIETVPKEPCKA